MTRHVVAFLPAHPTDDQYQLLGSWQQQPGVLSEIVLGRKGGQPICEIDPDDNAALALAVHQVVEALADVGLRPVRIETGDGEDLDFPL